MIQLPAGTKIWLAAGVTDLRHGFDGLSAQAQTVLQQQPFSGHDFIYRGRRGDIVKCFIGSTETGYAIPLQKTHNLSFENRKEFYPWHRWHALTVMTRAACGAQADQAYLCKLPDAPLDVMLVEIPKWMFDAAHCSTLCLMGIPRVDCETLRELKATIARFRVSVASSMLQPQVSRPAGDGDTDDSDFPGKSKRTAGDVRRTADGAKLERS